MKNVGGLKNNLGFCKVPEILSFGSLYPKDSHQYIEMPLPSPPHHGYLLIVSPSNGLLGWMTRFTPGHCSSSPHLLHCSAWASHTGNQDSFSEYKEQWHWGSECQLCHLLTVWTYYVAYRL